jgi:hypothetical protein
MPDASTFAAQVVLEGGPAQAGAAIASRAAELRPPAESVDRALRAFRALGFKTGPCVGNSFSIEGSKALYKTHFGVRVKPRDDGGVSFEVQAGSAPGSLPLQALPATLRQQVQAVLFTEPPAFGPGVMP